MTGSSLKGAIVSRLLYLAALNGPYIVLFEEQCANEPGDGVFVGEDTDDISAGCAIFRVVMSVPAQPSRTGKISSPAAPERLSVSFYVCGSPLHAVYVEIRFRRHQWGCTARALSLRGRRRWRPGCPVCSLPG
jgi:hypothetical protein